MRALSSTPSFVHVTVLTHMWQDLLAALALVLVIEGLLPFINPASFRRALLMVSQLDDSHLRFAGLTAMMIGCLLLYAVR